MKCLSKSIKKLSDELVVIMSFQKDDTADAVGSFARYFLQKLMQTV